MFHMIVVNHGRDMRGEVSYIPYFLSYINIRTIFKVEVSSKSCKSIFVLEGSEYPPVILSVHHISLYRLKTGK